MRDVTEKKDENLQLTVTTEPAIGVKGRTVQLKITHQDGTAYRQQFDIKEGKSRSGRIQPSADSFQPLER
jgi:hypothetical protein